jgi:molybdate transport system substrate-binding protein
VKSFVGLCAIIVMLFGFLPLLCGCKAPERPAPPSPDAPAKAAAKAPAPDPTEKRVVTVFAAASLTEALEQAVAKVMAEHPDLDVKPVFAGTQELLTQLDQGARADVFVSASDQDMKTAVEKGFCKTSRPFAENYLCVAAAKDGPVKTLEDLSKPGVKLLVAVGECPVGHYTRMCWAKMGEVDAFGPRFVADLHRNVCSEETNVKLVLSKVELGEADAGFVYESDALVGGDKVVKLDLPADVAVKATYSLGLCAEAENPEGGQVVIDAICGDLGKQALEASGIRPAANPAEVSGG